MSASMDLLSMPPTRCNVPARTHPQDTPAASLLQQDISETLMGGKPLRLPAQCNTLRALGVEANGD